ncbi:MAG: hypothetical protein ACR2NN_13685 [Bryobacteraceae bacterium]
MRAATLIVLALLCGCQVRKPASLHIDPALEKLVPSDTTFITGADIAGVRNTPVYQKWLGQVALPQLNDFTKQTGLDPRKDLSQVLSCSNGKTAVLLARGNFNSKDLEPRLAANGAAKSVYKGVSLFSNDRWAVAFPDSSTAAAGTTPELKSLIDNRGSRTHGLSPALRAKVDSIGANNQIWAAVVGGLQGLNIGVPEDSNLGSAIRLLQGIDTAAIGIDLRNGLDLQAEADCRTDRDAKRLNDAIRGLVGLGRLSTPDNQPDMLKLYDAVKVTQRQAHVQVVAQVGSDLVDKFLDLWLKRK